MGELSLITDGAVGIQGDRIVLVGSTQGVIAAAGNDSRLIDASGKVVMPGFVDPHTHVVFAGDRASEFEVRLQGASYMEILAAGGGIMDTVRATREASLGEIVSQSRKRLDRMLAHGTTTVEAKTGYGLDTESELKMLEAIRLLDESHPHRLGAHLLRGSRHPRRVQRTRGRIRRPRGRGDDARAGAGRVP
jgi:imidazolonepropionase